MRVLKFRTLFNAYSVSKVTSQAVRTLINCTAKIDD